MKIIIIGSGVIGLTTAWFLSREGHDITVIDRAEGPGQETSFANGALLTPSMAEPWNTPGVWRALLASLGRSDAPVQLRLRTLPRLSSWGIQFLRNSRVSAFQRNALSNLRLALYSLQQMQLLREETGIEYGRTARGSLRVFRDRVSLEGAIVVAERTRSEGLNFRRLSAAETIELEPTLAPIGQELVGSIHYTVDEVGDAYRFCVALAGCARGRGVKCYFGTEVSSLEMRAGHVNAVISDGRRFEADQYIVAAGSHSAGLLRDCGVHVPIQPVKGYSISFDRTKDHPLPRIPVVDDRLHAVAVPLEGAIRVAGTAEFAGYDVRSNPARISNLVGLLQSIFPHESFDLATAQSWCGLRSVSCDGVPIIGPTTVPNLMVNTGHGHLGWTMAAGAARLLTSFICKMSAPIDPTPFASDRF